MINVTIFETVAEIKISGKGKEFHDDLDRMKADIDTAHRHYEDFKKVWVITNFTDLIHLPYIKKAIEDHNRQGRLF